MELRKVWLSCQRVGHVVEAARLAEHDAEPRVRGNAKERVESPHERRRERVLMAQELEKDGDREYAPEHSEDHKGPSKTCDERVHLREDSATALFYVKVIGCLVKQPDKCGEALPLQLHRARVTLSARDLVGRLSAAVTMTDIEIAPVRP